MQASTNPNQTAAQASKSKSRAKKRPGTDQFNSTQSRKSQRTSLAADAAMVAHLVSTSDDITIINVNSGSSAADPVNPEEPFIVDDDVELVDMEQFDREWAQREDVHALNRVSINLPILMFSV